MGYDITFHPVSLDDIHRYVFDVIEQPDLAQARASDITSDPGKCREIERVYEQLTDWVGQLSDGKSLPLNETIGYATAQIAGFLHPYWYARNAAISSLDDDAVLSLFTPLTKLAGAPACLDSMEPSTYIGLNYTASGVVTDVDRLERNLERLGLDDKNDPPALFVVFHDAALASLREAMAYCKQHNLALIEAAEIVVPIADAARTDPDNFREAENFDESSSDTRRWFEPPIQERPSAFAEFRASKKPLLNDTVVVRRLFGRNRVATSVPLYLVPDLDRTKYSHDSHAAVLFEDGQIEPVRHRRLKLLQRASSHREYRRRLFEFERSYYEEQAKTHPGADIQSAQISIGDLPERILDMGLFTAYVGERSIADAFFKKALLAADIIVRDKHAERVKHGYPGSLATVMRTQWFARELRGQSQYPEVLIESCELYRNYAKNLTRSQWDEYKQCDYVEFVLTSLVAGRPDLALKMLEFRRPFDDQSELVSVYRSIANAGRGTPAAKEVLKRSMQLLEIIRYPQGGLFLPHGSLTGIQLALVTDRYLSEEPAWKSIRDIVDWLGQ